ncbi:MAG TPA: HAD-IA family hydrolase [Candidatus Nanoarchaeia archaeon]|nr:HAD-IA family hydrolase [Candidatus Nanoarchaeia archaeon]
MSTQVLKNIRAVVFDLDGVYFESGTQTFIKKLQETFSLSEDEIKEVYLKSQQMQEYKKGLMSGDVFWAFAIKTWGIKVTKEELLNLLVQSYEENPATIEFILHLRKKGVKIAACTNNFKERIEGLQKRFGFKNNFDVFVASCEEGVLKPDPAIFKIIAKKLGLSPQEILMSDDSEKVIDVLKDSGFQAFLYKGLADFKKRVS